MHIYMHTVLQDMPTGCYHISQGGWLTIVAAAICFCLNFSPSEQHFYV